MKTIRYPTRLAMAALLVAGTLVHAQQPAQAPSVETWTDDTTGLTWTICPAGQKVNSNDGQPYCDFNNPEEHDRYYNPIPLYEAVDLALHASTGGYTDWRLPTKAEALTVYKCELEQGPLPIDPTHKPRPRYRDVVAIEGGFYNCPRWYEHPRFINALGGAETWTTSPNEMPEDESMGRPVRAIIPPALGFRHKAYFVRGGTPNPEWQDTIGVARQLAQATADAAAAAQQKSQAANARLAAVTREDNAAADRELYAYRQRSKAVQANVRPGDRVAQGLVVQVKGSLVQVQTLPHQDCRYYSDTGQSCQQMPSQLVWIQRSTLLAPR